ncbi:M20/M25/M40 family metallo-hydrolase [Salimicrobium flavidum]|uniref:M42 glutamyl aminopeptidase n=1 Tax=Salimicrobium flavidum TaxID=570947 RepID=A0A1N7KFD2_9BACI|nr:M20/M25/M40 family metallo-hydrolase [Salimicrobium flavidum]SIS60174.1 M42 glutamyl aminopeptidase [Salimicrobium flavidum]
MKTWKQLFVGYGFNVTEKEPDVFSWEHEKNENIRFALEVLDRLGVRYELESNGIRLLQPPVMEKKWVDALNVPGRGQAEMIAGNPTLRQLDTHISGLVTQLNRLGLETVFSCDGHGKRPAHLDFVDRETTVSAVRLLEAFFGKRARVTREGIRINAGLAELTACAKEISEMDDIEKIVDIREEKRRHPFEEKLEKLLMIPGTSGEEEDIRHFVKEDIEPLVDDLVVDEYGNLLARKVCGSGRGPVVLLNAHLDTVDGIVPGRSILKKGSEWSSEEGILGADDRAGVAVILEVLRHVGNYFDGTLKIAFTVEEEIGLRGSRNVNPVFLWGVDAAFVLDRRGAGDVVVRGGGVDFCTRRFASWVKRTAGNGWSPVERGSSDARVWAEAGIETVNLSVGYRNEHTVAETLNVDACLETVELVKRLLRENRSLQRLMNRKSRISV